MLLHDLPRSVLINHIFSEISPAHLTSAVQVCHAWKEVIDSEELWQCIAQKTYPSGCVKLDGYGTFKALVLDDNQRHTARCLPLPPDVSCTWRRNRPDRYYECKLMTVEIESWRSHPCIWLTYDARGESDLRAPRTSALAVVTELPRGWLRVHASAKPASELLLVEQAGHYKGALKWTEAKSQLLLTQLSAGTAEAPRSLVFCYANELLPGEINPDHHHVDYTRATLVTVPSSAGGLANFKSVWSSRSVLRGEGETEQALLREGQEDELQRWRGLPEALTSRPDWSPLPQQHQPRDGELAPAGPPPQWQPVPPATLAGNIQLMLWEAAADEDVADGWVPMDGGFFDPDVMEELEQEDDEGGADWESADENGNEDDGEDEDGPGAGWVAAWDADPVEWHSDEGEDPGSDDDGDPGSGDPEFADPDPDPGDADPEGPVHPGMYPGGDPGPVPVPGQEPVARTGILVAGDGLGTLGAAGSMMQQQHQQQHQHQHQHQHHDEDSDPDAADPDPLWHRGRHAFGLPFWDPDDPDDLDDYQGAGDPGGWGRWLGQEDQEEAALDPLLDHDGAGVSDHGSDDHRHGNYDHDDAAAAMGMVLEDDDGYDDDGGSPDGGTDESVDQDHHSDQGQMQHDQDAYDDADADADADAADGFASSSGGADDGIDQVGADDSDDDDPHDDHGLDDDLDDLGLHDDNDADAGFGYEDDQGPDYADYDHGADYYDEADGFGWDAEDY